MATTRLQIIALDRVTYEDDVDAVVLPGIEGQLGVLPRHAPVVTLLQPGEVIARKGGQEVVMAVSGGFAEITGDRVIVLADAAERAEEIDIQRAQAARERAQARIQERGRVTDIDLALAEAALRRSLMRLKAAERVRRRRGGAGGGPPTGLDGG
jgi:F-type H+-transporting ATPase subunit epsilon